MWVKIKEWFRGFMRGRYGMDGLSRFLVIVGYVFWLAGLISRMAGSVVVGLVLYGLGLACVVWSIARAFSRGLEKRRRENDWYMLRENKVRRWCKVRINRFRQRKTHRFVPCPKCKNVGRIPRGKGEITITCPKCRHTFQTKS